MFFFLSKKIYQNFVTFVKIWFMLLVNAKRLKRFKNTRQERLKMYFKKLKTFLDLPKKAYRVQDKSQVTRYIGCD